MNSQVIIEKKENNIVHLILNKDAVNALDYDLIIPLIDKIKAIDTIRTRALLISSNGKHFCAGANLKKRSMMDNDDTIQFLDDLNFCFNMIENLSIPTFALINGAALGGGTELSLCFDFRLGFVDAKMGLPEVSLGIIPGAGGTQRLPRLIGLGRAKELILSGEIIDANKAFNIGLLNKVLKTGDELNESFEFINTIIKNAPLSLKNAKRAVGLGTVKKNINEGLEVERNAYLKVMNSQDKEEGIDAFINKRKPNWKGK